MAGVRQHFIPRFLQKGFKAVRKGKGTYCWVYEKGKPPRIANIQDVGLERHFYAVESETDLDDKITIDEERLYSPLIDNLRAGNLNNEVIPHIPKLLAHFEIRSRNVRSNMLYAFESLAEGVGAQLRDPAILGRLLERHLTLDSDLLQKELGKAGMSVAQLKALLRQTGMQFRDLLAPFIANMARSLPDLLAPLKSSLRDNVKKSHVKLLKQSTAPDLRAQRFTSLHYSIENFVAANLPLGDSIILFLVKGERSFKPFLDKSDELVAVILPLAKDKYLLGASPDFDSIPSDLPTEIARCSLEYFISAENDEKSAELHALVGSNSHWFSSEEIQSILDDVFKSQLDGQI